MNQIEGEFNTIWPIFDLSLNDYLNKKGIQFILSENRKNFSREGLPSNMGFLNLCHKNDFITDTDLFHMGQIKDRLERYIRFYFYQEKGINGNYFKIGDSERFIDIQL